MGVFDAFWLATTLRLSTPLILASSGELLAERTGVLNIGLEGFMLAGAFFGFLGTYLSGSFLVGVVFAIVAGVIFAAAMAFLSIRLSADQIVVGIGINILALGLTSFVFREVFSGPQVLLERPAPWRWPLLSDIPGVGEALFAQPGWVYVAGVVVLAVWFVLQRTTWGLSMRATGELPEAADTAGSSVFRNRWIATLVAGGLAGAGGSFLSIELGVFIEGMTNGRGYLALAAVIFGRWRAPGVLLACLLFGGADAMQLRLQAEATVPLEVWLVLALLGPAYLLIRRRSVRSHHPLALAAVGCVTAIGGALAVTQPQFTLPAQLWRTFPFVLTIVVLAGFIGRSWMPSTLAIPYNRESDT
ncbi:MAG: ABC transporter permease [bacterium]|nr:ABC transporter permease [bacterium]MDE0288268.1 ABC transporter permease [bacterium]MDE0439275.1 ABC transporter permease [bacterium]